MAKQSKLEQAIQSLKDQGCVESVRRDEVRLNNKFYKIAVVTMTDGKKIVLNNRGGTDGIASTLVNRINI